MAAASRLNAREAWMQEEPPSSSELPSARQIATLVATQEREQQNLSQQLWGSVRGIKQKVERLQGQIKSLHPGSDCCVETLATAISAIEAQLVEAKDRQRQEFEELRQAEELLDREVELDLSWLEAASTSAPDEPPPVVPHRSPERKVAGRRPVSAPGHQREAAGRRHREPGGLLPEVVEAEEFADRHGECGGWQPAEHQEFLGVLRACQGDYGHTVLVCLEHMVGVTRADVIAHARWHQEHEDLQLRKRLAIARWRAEREAEKAALVAQAEFLPPAAKQAQEEAAASSVAEAVERLREKAALQEWQQRKAQQQQEAEAHRARAAEAQRHRDQQRLMARQEANRAKLAMAHSNKADRQRQAALHAAASMPPLRPPGSLDPEDAERVQRRNDSTLQRRQQLVQAKVEVQQERQERQQRLAEKCRVEAPRDPYRLLQPTAAALAHLEAVQQQRDTAQPRDSGFILKVSHLAVPSWRNNLRGQA